MNALVSLSALARALFTLWALLLCAAGLGGALLAAVKKRVRLTLLALLLLAPAYLAWQMLFDLSLRREAATALSRLMGSVPWLCWLSAFCVLSLAGMLLLICNLRHDRTSVTPGTIKLYLDGIPCGVCCWRDNGRVLFSNVCMNRLCTALTNAPLRNGNHFRDAAKDGILTVEGRVWRFSCRDIPLDGELLHEMIASDITSEYAKTQALEREKAELSQLNRELREYCLSIDDTVRRQEILQAKANIHDEMNRLMLSTTATDGTDTAALDRIFLLWERNALLLCMEADETGDAKAASGIEKLAAALKLRLHWTSALPAALSKEQRALFFSAAQEAIVNAVKHAEAKTMELSFPETEEALCCCFTNDGKTAPGPVRFTGGLANLALLAAKQGAAVSACADEPFTLTLSFPKKPKSG